MKTRKSISELPFNTRIIPGGDFLEIDADRNGFRRGMKYAAIHMTNDFRYYVWFRRHTYYLTGEEE